jgi:hypothetical protein
VKIVADSLLKRLKESDFYTVGYSDEFIGTEFEKMQFAMRIVAIETKHQLSSSPANE